MLITININQQKLIRTNRQKVIWLIIEIKPGKNELSSSIFRYNGFKYGETGGVSTVIEMEFSTIFGEADYYNRKTNRLVRWTLFLRFFFSAIQWLITF